MEHVISTAPLHLPDAYDIIRSEPKTVSVASIPARSGLPPLFCHADSPRSESRLHQNQPVGSRGRGIIVQVTVLIRPSLSDEESGRQRQEAGACILPLHGGASVCASLLAALQRSSLQTGRQCRQERNSLGARKANWAPGNLATTDMYGILAITTG